MFGLITACLTHGCADARAGVGGWMIGSVRDVFEPRRVLGGGLSNRLTTRLQPMVAFMRDNPMAGEWVID